MSAKLRVFAIVFVLAVVLDQATKLWVDTRVAYGAHIEVIEGIFSITHVRNPGAAFGLFADGPAHARQWFFIGVAALAAFIIVSFLRQLAPGDRTSALALGLILGGATGNLIDRIWRGEVVDFLHVRLWGGRTWPDFNLADSFIVIGVAILVLELIAGEAEQRAGERGAEVDS